MGSNRYGPKPRPGNFNVTDYENQAYGVFWQGKTKEIEDNLGIRTYVGSWSGANFLTIADFVELINAGMGLDMTEEELVNYYAVIGRNLEKHLILYTLICLVKMIFHLRGFERRK